MPNDQVVSIELTGQTRSLLTVCLAAKASWGHGQADLIDPILRQLMQGNGIKVTTSELRSLLLELRNFRNTAFARRLGLAEPQYEAVLAELFWSF